MKIMICESVGKSQSELLKSQVSFSQNSRLWEGTATRFQILKVMVLTWSWYTPKWEKKINNIDQESDRVFFGLLFPPHLFVTTFRSFCSCFGLRNVRLMLTFEDTALLGVVFLCVWLLAKMSSKHLICWTFKLVVIL